MFFGTRWSTKLSHFRNVSENIKPISTSTGTYLCCVHRGNGGYGDDIIWGDLLPSGLATTNTELKDFSVFRFLNTFSNLIFVNNRCYQ